MDRQTIYAGQIPLETDQLKQSQNTMVGLAKLAAAVLGATTIVNGFTVTPTTPASLNVLVVPGEIYQLENLEQSSWSSLPADTHTILKQGILLNPATFGIVPPTTVGYSQTFLVEVQYEDVDSGSTVLPYFNANTPSVPYAGPGNAGTAQNTVRQGVAAVQVKAGVAAPTGTQSTPTQDAGWTGVYLITVANGATTITSGNITQVGTAPWIPVTLPNVPAGVQSGIWLYGVDSGAVNAMVASVTPIPLYLTPGMTVHVRASFTNTGPVTLNLNGLGASSIHRANGSALSPGDINAGMVVELIWDGAAWQIANYFGFSSSTTNNNTYTLSIPYAADSSAVPNAIVAAPAQALTALSAGQEILVKLANTNTGPVTVAVSSLPAVNVVNGDGSALTENQIVAGEMLWLLFDGTNFQRIGRNINIILTAPRTFYVNALTGSDQYDGLSAVVASGHGPFATLQKANDSANLFNLNGFSIDIIVANGTYGGVSLSNVPGSGYVNWVGNVTTPSSCIIKGVNQSAVFMYNGGNHTFTGFMVESSGTSTTDGCSGFAVYHGTMSLGVIEFGQCVGAHIQITEFGSASNMVPGNWTITGGCSGNSFIPGDFMQLFASGTFNVNPLGNPTLTIANAVSFAGAFIDASFNSFVELVFASVTGAGYVSGRKFSVTTNSVISSSGSGVSYYPGSNAGYEANGGQYV